VWLALEPQSVHVAPSSQLKRYEKPAAASAELGSAAPDSETAMLVPSVTDAGALKVADGATLLTVTVAAYSALSPPSLSCTWPLIVRVPLSAVAQAWLEIEP
jgi:hypothetical protein